MVLAGCGYFRGHPQGPSAASAPARPGMSRAAETAVAGMIDAVGPPTGGEPVRLKFEIRSRPEVGQPDEIDYALIPVNPGIDSLRALFGARDGLDVLGAEAHRQLPKPATGEPIFGSITVKPLSAGIFTVTAAVGVSMDGQTVVWPFSIPVIVGASAPGAPTSPGKPNSGA
jgi:hypothetical protein